MHPESRMAGDCNNSEIMRDDELFIFSMVLSLFGGEGASMLEQVK